MARRGPQNARYARKGAYGRKGRDADPGDEREERPYSYAPRSGTNPAVIVFAVTGLLIVALGAFIFIGGRGPTGLSTDGGGAVVPENTICGVCKGSGQFDCEMCSQPGTSCSTCDGLGYLQCGACGGTGR